MYKRFFLFLGILAALAPGSLAQNNRSHIPVAVRISGENSDPWGLLEDDDDATAGVKASVVVNMAGAERSAFDLINRKREENGLGRLTWSEEIAAIARLHSQNMAEFRFFSHRGLDSKMVSDRADAQGTRKWRSIGENIAFNRGYKDPIEKAVQLWLDSPEHRRNMMDSNWKESAVGVAVASDGSYYFTQVFITRRQ